MPEPYVPTKEAAAYLGVGVGTLRDWVHRRLVPSHKVGGARRFRLSELDAWIEDETRKAAS